MLCTFKKNLKLQHSDRWRKKKKLAEAETKQMYVKAWLQ